MNDVFLQRRWLKNKEDLIILLHFQYLRLTIHTVEDLQKELERKANVTDRQHRPNSPDWQSGHNTEPLIYSPRHPPPSTPPRPKVGRICSNTPPPIQTVLLTSKIEIKEKC